MIQTLAISRQQRLEELGPFLLAAWRAFERRAPAFPDRCQAFAGALTAECVQCGIRLTGVELVDAFRGDPAEVTAPKLARLRKGYCARQGCDSHYCRLNFAELSGVEWEEIFKTAEAGYPTETAENSAAQDAPLPETRARGPGAAARYAVVLAVVALALGLWAARQWYRGGTIPFLRQPESFEVSHGAGSEIESGR